MAADVGLVVLDHAGDTYAAFKTLAALHVRVRDMRVVTSTVAPGKRTLQRYLRMDTPRPESEAFPTALSPYLDGIMHFGRTTKLLFRAGFFMTAHRERLLASAPDSAVCPHCCVCPDETAAHFVLECPAFAARRVEFLRRLTEVAGEAKFQAWAALELEPRLLSLLGDACWGEAAPAVDGLTQQFLGSLRSDRQRREVLPPRLHGEVARGSAPAIRALLANAPLGRDGAPAWARFPRFAGGQEEESSRMVCADATRVTWGTVTPPHVCLSRSAVAVGVGSLAITDARAHGAYCTRSNSRKCVPPLGWQHGN